MAKIIRDGCFRSKILKPKNFFAIKVEINQEGVLRPNGKLAIKAEKNERGH